MAATLSIIIVNWNSLDYLRACLRSLACDQQAPPFEIIVVDNCSLVDPTAVFRDEFPSITVIRSENNLGFSAANNLGFRSSSGKYLLFLNPDTEIIGSALSTLTSCIAELPDAGILGCTLLNSNGTLQTSCIQRFPTILNQLLDFDFLRSRWPRWPIWGIAPLFARPAIPVAVEVISGACLMMPRHVFERIGGFNETFFMYAEDVELCYRTSAGGYKVYYTGQARVIHHGGGSTKSRTGNSWVAVMQRRAILQFCRQAHGASYAATYRAAMILSSIVRLAILALLRVLSLFSATEPSSYNSACAKWTSVLRWALGLEPGTPSN
jgi:GT2 family glycosyltransferase